MRILQLDSHLPSLHLSVPFSFHLFSLSFNPFTLFSSLHLLRLPSPFSLPQQPTQVELGLLIFRRLTEDIHTFPEGLSPPRRREMVAALTADVETVFAFLLQNLEV